MSAKPNFVVSGTPATGDVPTRQANGTVAWAAAGGGSMPSWWTVVDTPGSEHVTFGGRVIVDAGAVDKPLIVVADPNSTSDAFVITQDTDEPFSVSFGIDPLGYIAGSGASLQTVSDNTVLDVRPWSSQTVYDVARFFGVSNINPVLRIRPSGSIIMGFLPTSDPAAAGELWNDAGTVKVSAG